MSKRVPQSNFLLVTARACSKLQLLWNLWTHTILCLKKKVQCNTDYSWACSLQAEFEVYLLFGYHQNLYMQERTTWMEKGNSAYYKGSPMSSRKHSVILRKPVSLIITVITTYITKISPKGFWRTANLDLCGCCLTTPACSDTTTHHSNTSFFVIPELKGKPKNFCFQTLANWSIL